MTSKPCMRLDEALTTFKVPGPLCEGWVSHGFTPISLNELPSSRVVKLPEERPSALISDISPTSSSSAHDLQPIRDIFAFSSEDPDPSETERFSDRDVGPKRAMLFSARRKEGNRKLREIARILRSRISRESEVSKKGSKKGSKKKTRSDASEEDIERRKELKRALHRRLEEELLQDKTSEEGYDADAIPIKTPNGTWSRTDGSSRYDSGRLRPGVGRFEPPSPSLGRGLDQQHHPSNYGGQRRASTSTKNGLPDQFDQVLGLQRTSCNSLAEDNHIPATSKNQPQIITARQYNSTGQRFKRSDVNSHQVDREDASEVRNVRNLHPSRSASFFDFRPHKDRNRVASRYPSMQNIMRNPDSTGPASNTRDVDSLVERSRQWTRGSLRFIAPNAENEDTQYRYDLNDSTFPSHELRRDAEIEQIGAAGFDGGSESHKNRVDPLVPKKTVARRSVSFSLDPVHDIHTAPDAFSKLLVPSKSLSQLDPHGQRAQVSNGNGSPLLHHVKTRQERRNSSSGITHLKVPDASSCFRRNVASSNYSSHNDSLASSRRSSLMKLQSLSERLDYIKNDPKGRHSESAWSSALDIPRVPSSQFITAEIGDARRRILEAERWHASAPTVKAPTTSTGKSRSPSPQPGLVDLPTEPFYEDNMNPNRSVRRKRRYGLRFEGSEGRCPSNVDGSDEWYRSSGRHGYGYDLVTPGNEDATSLWGKAFQDHADRDSTHSKTRLGSVSTARSPQSLEKRAQGSKTRPARPRLRRGIEYSSSDFWKKRLQPNYRLDLDQPCRKDASKPGNRLVFKRSSPGPPASWSRFPSHTRAERSFSPAGEADNVTARDFALEFETMEAPNGERKSKLFRLRKKRKSGSMTYGESLMSTLNRIYSLDLRRLNRGHRSSISVGGKLEYPELEILPPLSPSPRPLDETSKRDIAAVLKALHSNSSQQSVVQEADPINKTIVSAGAWSKMYQDCVYYPADIDDSLVTDTLSVRSHAHRVSGSTGGEVSDDPFSPRSSAEMRTSTLDFQKALQDDEVKAQERALKAADDAWGKSTPSVV